ncbi:cell wall hydrolase [Parasphingopyxis sp. CP4]|uniref:cell wall hydrolase n=1 Tax=Parasphingopyxis sp. CP4 TaxID=2724527 RepID=UPI002107CB3A|nr:cell wall hydrolase [Parasphingopyxis sp. CP4]
MQGSWAEHALLRPSTARDLHPVDDAETRISEDFVLERMAPDQPRTRGKSPYTIAAAFIGMIGLLTLSAASLAVPERGVTVALPEARPFSELVGEAEDGSQLPLTLTPAEEAAVRAAIEAELAAQSGYDGPRPRGIAFPQASSADRERALQCMTQAIYYEAGNEPEAGQRAVAQVVLNRVRHPGYANTICGVVYEGSERSTGCQFTFTCDGALARRPVPSVWARSQRYAREAIAGRSFGEVGYATHYHTLDVWPYWGRSLTMTNMIGRHLFHRLRGTASSPGAFSVRYSGREPAPRPWRPNAEEQQADGEGELLIEDLVEDNLPPAPQLRGELAEAEVDAVSNNLPTSQVIENALPDSQVRPEHRNSGQWIGS